MARRDLFRYSLYTILDLDLPYLKKNPFLVAKDLIRGGTDILQLRAKKCPEKYLVEIGLKIKKIAEENKVILIINNRIDIAQIIKADGVHLGQEDIPVNYARNILGKNSIIGLSTHNLFQAKRAQLLDIDYISIGPIFKSPTKPELKPIGIETLKKVKKISYLPVVAIGGINLENIHKVLSGGADTIALISAILKDKEPSVKVKLFKELLKNFAYNYE